jgi:acyl-CoA thioester hydrolase
MISRQINIRVRYAETDQMGYVYYGNYAAYFEMGRVELLRSIGTSYKKLEDEGIMLPVRDFSIRYIKPALYDDLLTLTTKLTETPSTRIHFTYQIHNEEGTLLCKAETTLVFVDKKNGRPVSVPDELKQKMISSADD